MLHRIDIAGRVVLVVYIPIERLPTCGRVAGTSSVLKSALAPLAVLAPGGVGLERKRTVGRVEATGCVAKKGKRSVSRVEAAGGVA